MRSLLIVLAGACASLSTSLAVWITLATEDHVYYEVLDEGLVQTTASEHEVNLAVSAAMEADRAPAASAEQRLTDAEYHEAATAWFAPSGSFGRSGERVSLLERSQVGRNGQLTQILVYHGPEMPTLVFVRHDDPSRRDAMAQAIGGQLRNLGITQR